MKTITKLAAVTGIAIASLASVNSAHAVFRSAVHLNAEGREACAALGNQGYVAKVRGRQLYAPSGRFNSGSFIVRYCFQTRNQCMRFINRFENILYPVESISYRGCKVN
ncbi:MAG: hypothetical protein AAF412_06025 [Pseudomonadota bacterium]